VEPTAAFAQLQPGFVDQIQWCYEVSRPLALLADLTATQRAHETETHPDTARTLQRRFHQRGMLGLIPGHVQVTARGRAAWVPDAVCQEGERLKACYASFHYRELARILFFTFDYPAAITPFCVDTHDARQLRPPDTSRDFGEGWPTGHS
jgi:hypothetical protein